ncbi:MAG: hypothetical protein RDV41_15920, partial [Planctomycetota bacterium]|nr:hypothetical protein [Planctomycetota bacterium]
MDHSDRLRLFGIVVLVLVAGFFAFPSDDKPGFGEEGFLRNCKMTPGLDLRGGAEIRLRIVKEELPDDVSLRDAMTRTVEVLERRVNTMGLKEPSIRPFGEEEIVIQVPGGEPHEVQRVKDIVSKSGKLVFMIEATEEVLRNYKYPDRPAKHLWLPFAEKEKAGEAATHML